MPDSNTSVKRIVAALYPGCVSLDLTGPLEAFHYATLITEEETGRNDCGYSIEMVAKDAGPVETMSGVKVHADHSYADFKDDIDILLIPGMRRGDLRYLDDDLTGWINRQSARSQRVVSICSGAFVLAHAGILAGHKVTTHWNQGKVLRDTFTDVEVDDSRIFCKSGNIYSSAGVTAGIDLALSIIEEDFGHALALKIAKRMVVFLKRPGDQSQFSDLLSAQGDSKRFSQLLAWIEKNLGAELTVASLAEQCAMSPRNFSRNFSNDIGFSPMQYICRRRLEWARLLIEDADQQLGTIAQATGFVTLNRFTSAFKDAFHTTPVEYRKRFQ